MAAISEYLDAGAEYASILWNSVAGSRTFEAGNYGWYILEVTDIHSCYAIDSVYIANNTSIGDAYMFDGQLKVYPNPSHDMLFVELQSLDNPDIVLEIFDALGRKIMAKEFHHVNGIIESLDVSDIPKGIYYLRIRKDKQLATRKIIIE